MPRGGDGRVRDAGRSLPRSRVRARLSADPLRAGRRGSGAGRVRERVEVAPRLSGRRLVFDLALSNRLAKGARPGRIASKPGPSGDRGGRPGAGRGGGDAGERGSAGAAEPARSAPSARLERLLATLPEAARAVVTLFYYEDRSVSDVAAALGIPEGTVKTHLYRSRAALREGWLREEQAESDDDAMR